jgi:hypothetical protein
MFGSFFYFNLLFKRSIMDVSAANVDFIAENTEIFFLSFLPY